MRRRTHNKTRTGCSTCKRRKIKCDEAKPKCRNCQIHSAIECKYEPAAQDSSPAFPQPIVVLKPPGPGAYSLRHMELLLQFTTSTALTFSTHPRVRELWSSDVPRLGLAFPFVLHAVLALSSMHLAHQRPNERRYHWTCAIELQQQAVIDAQKSMESISAEKCSALFAFSALTCVFAPARGLCDSPSPQTQNEADVGCNHSLKISSLLEWVSFYRGVRLFLNPPYRDALNSGPLAPMFEISWGRRKRLIDASPAGGLAKVQQLLDFKAAIHLHIDDASRLDSYDCALAQLQRCYCATSTRSMEGLEGMDVFAWMFLIPDSYVSLLKQRDAVAMALFVPFAVLIRRLRDKWWAQHWSEWCIDLILSELRNTDAWLLQQLSELTQDHKIVYTKG